MKQLQEKEAYNVNREEICVLQESCRNISRVLGDMELVMPKIYDEELSYELNCQANGLRELERKVHRTLGREGITTKEPGAMERLRSWSSLQAGTMLNISTAYMADKMIRDNANGITNLMKVVHNNKKPGSYANELAGELMDFEEKNIEKLKTYL